VGKCDLLVICVNYNSDEDTLSFTKDLLSQKNSQDIHVLIADNSTRSGFGQSLELPKSLLSQVSIFDCDRNLGYFGAAAKALNSFLLTNALPNWVAVSNTDLSLSDRDFVTRLTAIVELENCAIVAPAIQSSLTGRDQNPYMKSRPSKARMHFYKHTFASPILTAIYLFLSDVKRVFRGKPQSRNVDLIRTSGTQEAIYAPHGSFILFTRKYFEAGGTLNHGTFLYGEEIFVAETARSLGLAVRYNPSLKLVHREHTTTKQVGSDTLFKFRRDAAKYCADTFFG